MRKRLFKNIDKGIVICVAILITISLIALFSATSNSNYDDLKKQIIWLIISIPVVIVVVIIDYKTITKISPFLYGVFLVLLVLVMFTKSINGARSWFRIGSFLLQPSEFAKVLYVVTLAYLIVKIQKNSVKEINKLSKLLFIGVFAIIPIVLIALQPDYGTALAYCFATIFMIFVAGIDKKYIIIAILLIVILLPILYFFVLPEHAKSRIEVFLNPELDPRGSGYNAIQSKIAIGSGQLFGMGVLKGNQTQLGFLYPKTTDFIYAVICEEMGFIISGGLVVVYIVLINKIMKIAKEAKDDLGSYIATGIAGIFSFHMIQNIGMTIGMLPITGVPLPFISYGGSSLLTNLILIGLLLNISGRKRNVY